MTEYTFKFNNDQLERLARLSPNGDWKEALDFHINSLIADKVGRASIFGPSGKGKVKAPSSLGDY